MFVVRRVRFAPPAAALVLCVAIGALACPAPLRAESLPGAQPEPSARDLHVWGRFGVGTWKQARIITETLNAKGQVVDTTITETKTTLTKADSRQLSLRIEATVEVAGTSG